MRYLLYISFIAVLLSACKEQSQKPLLNISKDSLDKALEVSNKQMLQAEERQITDLLNRYNWNAEKTATGLRFLIYLKGKGLTPVLGSKVKIHFKVALINGVECYDSEIDGAKEFVIGRSDEINGLEEGLMMMKVGDKAKLVIPSYLAFGLPGDMNKIPMRATLIYDVELLSVINP